VYFVLYRSSAYLYESKPIISNALDFLSLFPKMTRKKPTILHVIDSLGVGGAEVLLLHTIQSLSEYNHVVVYLNSPHHYLQQLQQYATVLRIPFARKLNIFFCVWKLARVIKKHEVSLVHAHLWWATLIARWATPSNTPFIFTLHSLLSRDPFDKNGWSLKLEKMSYQPYHRVVAVSQSALEDYNQCVGLKGKHDVVYNFVSDHFFLLNRSGSPGKQLRIMTIGNLKKAKNYLFLLECLKHVKGVDYSLDIYGEGPLEDEIRRVITRDNLPVHLKGICTEPAKILVDYDLFVMASSHEGYGIALAEAMASGLPVLVSDIPVFHEVAGETAFYFSLNDPAHFSTVLQEIFSTFKRGGLAQSGLLCREQARKVASREQYLKKIRTVYESSLNATE
jgi:glycosyltransferase involved in cell wall biosynthesis